MKFQFFWGTSAPNWLWHYSAIPTKPVIPRRLNTRKAGLAFGTANRTPIFRQDFFLAGRVARMLQGKFPAVQHGLVAFCRCRVLRRERRLCWVLLALLPGPPCGGGACPRRQLRGPLRLLSLGVECCARTQLIRVRFGVPRPLCVVSEGTGVAPKKLASHLMSPTDSAAHTDTACPSCRCACHDPLGNAA